MKATPDTVWLERFAARLLRLMPELSAVEAVRIAVQQFDKSPHADPVEAAERYAGDNSATRA